MTLQILLKPGVILTGAHFEEPIARIVAILAATCPPTSDGILWITSGRDGHHMPNSFHYRDAALDFRIHNIAGVTEPYKQDPKVLEWVREARALLGPNYDLVIEVDHLHVERDTHGSV